MRRLKCNITIGAYTFDFVYKLTVESTWQQLTQTCTIELPSTVKLDRNQLRKALKKGDAVSVSCWYDGQRISNIFEGYVSRILPGMPIVIECEDLMWKLKQVKVTKNANNTTFAKYLGEVLTVPVDCFDVQLPKFTVINLTGAQLLSQLKQDYGLAVFVRKGKVVVGKQYDRANASSHTFFLDNTNTKNIKENNLEYWSNDDVKVKVKAISNQPDGSKIEYSFGDEGGDERTLNFFNLSMSGLEDLAKKEYEKLMYDGFRGDIVTFGEPVVYHGDIVRLVSNEDADVQGSYFVDGVVYEFGVYGFQQTVTIGQRFKS